MVYAFFRPGEPVLEALGPLLWSHLENEVSVDFNRLFGAIKQQTAHLILYCREKEVYGNFVFKVASKQWVQRFQNWFARMEKCIDHKDESF